MKKLILLLLLFPLHSFADNGAFDLDSDPFKYQRQYDIDQYLKESTEQKKLENQLLQNELSGTNRILERYFNNQAQRYDHPTYQQPPLINQELINSILNNYNNNQRR